MQHIFLDNVIHFCPKQKCHDCLQHRETQVSNQQLCQHTASSCSCYSWSIDMAAVIFNRKQVKNPPCISWVHVCGCHPSPRFTISHAYCILSFLISSHATTEIEATTVQLYIWHHGPAIWETVRMGEVGEGSLEPTAGGKLWAVVSWVNQQAYLLITIGCWSFTEQLL